MAYFDNGQKRAEGEFRKGRRHGRWVRWLRDGSPEKAVVFEDGEEVSSEILLEAETGETG